jgi:tetratricopeptide (TPR) repeat protein
LFFDRFRDALSRLPAGLIRPGTAADPKDVAAAEATLGRPLPPDLASFLRSFDGVDLFHESVVLAGVGRQAARQLVDLNPRRPPDELVFAETATGDRFALQGDGAVVRLREGDEDDGAPEGAEERWRAGSNFTIWLDALIAHERVLYGSDGEFQPDAFEPDGAEILPLVALRQAERALKLDPGSAEFHHERAVALRRLGREDAALAAFREAAALDPRNPWASFDLGRAALSAGVAGAREALDAFERAGRLDDGEAGARFWIWGARAATLLALPERLAACRKEALARVPSLASDLKRARDAAAAGDEPEALAEAESLVAALEDPIGTGRSRLAVVMADAPPQKKAPADVGRPVPEKSAAAAKKRPRR